jgi:uncharacterized caspase-like protein
MVCRVVYFIVVCLTLGMSPGAQAEGRRVALVIGQNAYQNLSKLSNPTGDAARFAAILKKNGVDVISCDGKQPGCFNLNRAGMLDALEEFKARAKGADVAIVFYAGHGMQLSEGNVIAPIDIKIDCKALTPRRHVPLQSVIEAVSGAADQIIILDACRDDPLQKVCNAHNRGAQILSFGRINMPKARRVMLVSSTKAGQVASDGLAGQHSPFAQALFDTLENSAHVYFDQVFNRVAKAVIERTSTTSFTQIPERLVSGIAPERCLAGNDCASDPRANALAAELAMLKKLHARDQICVASARSLFNRQSSRSVVASGKVPKIDREAAMKALAVACGGLTDFGDRGAQAQEEIAKGNTAAAEKLYAEALAHEEKAAKTAAEQAAQRRKKAASHAGNLAGLSRWTDPSKAVGYYKKALALDPDDRKTWNIYVKLVLNLGNTAQAKTAFEEIARTARTSKAQISRFWANIGLGDIAEAQGNLASAWRLYETAVEIGRRAAEADPGDMGWQRDLSVSYNKIGDVLKAQGNLGAALNRYEAALTIVERLAQADADNVGWQHDLSVSYGRVGGVLNAQGNLPAALTHYEASLTIAERLAKADASNAGWQRDVYSALWYVADVQIKQGNLSHGLEKLQRSKSIMERLAKADANNAGWQHDLSVSYIKLGEVLVAQGNLAAALQSFMASLTIFERLAKTDPNNASWQRDLSVSYSRVGDVLKAQGNLVAALQHYKAFLAIAERLAKADANNAGWQRDLSVSYIKVGALEEVRGNIDAAIKSYEESLPIAKSLADRFPDHPQFQSDFLIIKRRLEQLRKRRH